MAARPPNGGGQASTSDRGGRAAPRGSFDADGPCPRKEPGVRQFRRPGRKYVLIALAASVAAAAALGLTPVLAGGKKVQTGFIGGLEVGAASWLPQRGPLLPRRTSAFDKRQLARCATPGYRATYPSRCPAMTPSRARAERAQRTALRSGRATARPTRSSAPRPKVLRVNRALKRAFAAGEPPSSIGAWTGRIVAPGPPDQRGPAAHRQGALVGLPAEARTSPTATTPTHHRPAEPP